MLVLLQGMAVAAIGGRVSRALASDSERARAGTAAALVPAVVLVPVGIVLALGALVVAALPRALPSFLAARSSPRGIVLGRVLLAVGVLAAAPAFIGAV